MSLVREHRGRSGEKLLSSGGEKRERVGELIRERCARLTKASQRRMIVLMSRDWESVSRPVSVALPT